ncbi:MAG: PucR family transcriptional regulator [Pseudomonadota bacterium]
MTQVITRYFDSAGQARSVMDELLYRRRFSQNIVRLFDQADGLAQALTEADVDPATAQAYQNRMGSGGAVVMVRAGYKPLGVARITRQVLADMGAADLGGLSEEVSVKDPPYTGLSVYPDSPLFLTRRHDPKSTTYHMADWPIPLISRRKPFTGSIIPRNGHMANWPIPLLSDRKPYTESMFPRHARMANFLLPLLSQRKPYTKSIFARHARMADRPVPLLSKRKPYDRSWISRHGRMANWPFPLLINGKRGTNSLMPGEPYMANWPIKHLSSRKPFTKSIFPRNAHMANFPIPLLSKRKPYSDSLIPRHGRMADKPVPLLTDDIKDMGPNFTVSGLFGIPTILRRQKAS